MPGGRRPFADLLEAALLGVERSCPGLAAGFAARLGVLRVAVEVDGEACSVVARGGRAVVVGPGDADVRLRTSRSALGRLVRGERGLVEACILDELAFDAPPALASEVYEALLVWLAGAVRTPTLVPLVRELDQ